MSEHEQRDECECDDSDGAGCLFLFGIVIVSICVGNLYEQIHGWLCLGLLMTAGSIIGRRK